MSSIEVSTLVCGSVKGVDMVPCTTIGKRIANALIKVASLRIFADPEQSLMELPVNSVDSYARRKGTQEVGKFGMGFFSIFYWIIKNPDLYVLIQSTYMHGGKRLSYQVKIEWTANGLVLTRLEDKQVVMDFMSGKSSTGTYISIINSKREMFPPAELHVHINKYINRLKYIKTARIENVGYGAVNPASPELPLVIFETKYSSLSVRDNAEGIPIGILLRTMLIPSSSTKERPAAIQGSLELPQILDGKKCSSPFNSQFNNHC